jgi:hypothetical protein
MKLFHCRTFQVVALRVRLCGRIVPSPQFFSYDRKIRRVAPRATALMDSMTTIHHLTQDRMILACNYRGAATSAGATI